MKTAAIVSNGCSSFFAFIQISNKPIKRVPSSDTLAFLFLHCRNKTDLFKHFVNLCAVLLCSDNIA